MLTLSKAIAAASLFTSKEKVRPDLHYIALIPRNEFLLVSATDNKSAFFGKVHLPADFGSEIKFIAEIIAKGVKPNSLCTIQGKQLLVDGARFDLKRDGDDVRFPDVIRVIPRNLSGSSIDDMSCYLLSPTIGDKISKAEKIITGITDGLPSFVLNGRRAWLSHINENAFIVVMPYRANFMSTPTAGLYENLTTN